MTDGSMATYLIYDPHEHLDAMHASLFLGEEAIYLPCPHMGAKIETELDHMGILQTLLELAGDDRLDRTAFYRLYRRRREHGAYLRALLDLLEEADRPYLAALLCRNAVKRLPRRRFHDGLAAARAKLAERGVVLEGV